MGTRAWPHAVRCVGLSIVQRCGTLLALVAWQAGTAAAGFAAVGSSGVWDNFYLLKFYVHVLTDLLTVLKSKIVY